MQTTQDKFLTVGYGGYVLFNNQLCQTLSASVTKTYNIPTFNPYYQPHDGTGAQAVIRGAYGTCSFSGQISFQLTVNMLNEIFQQPKENENKYTGFFDKDQVFSLQINDGQNSVYLPGCVWQSVNIQCQPSSLVTCSISFQCHNNGNEFLAHSPSSSSSNESPAYTGSDYIPYWQTGASNMLQFNMTIDRTVTPVYLNNDKIAPTYLRSGLINISLNATYYDANYNSTYSNNYSDFNQLSIKIGNKKINFKKTILQSNDFKMSTMQDIGEKTCQWKSIPLDYNKPVFQIENIKKSD